MKTCKRVAKSAVLAIVLCASIIFSVPRSYALSSDFILGQALGIIQGAWTTQRQLDDAKMVLRHSWSNDTVTSSHLLEVSGDVLQSYIAAMNSGGNPAEIVYSSSVGGSGVSGYWIRAVAEPFFMNSSGYSRVDADVVYTGRHYGVFNYSSSYDVYYYVYAKTLSSNSLLDSIKSRIDSIWNWGQAGGLLTTINTSLSDIARITSSLNTAFNTYSSSVTTWLSNKSQEITNIANRLVVTRDGTQYAITTLVSWIYDAFYITRSDTGRTGITAITNWIYNELSGNLNTRLTAIQTNTANTAARLVISRSDGDYSLANLTNHIWDSVGGVESTLSTISSRVNTTNTRLNTVITNTSNTANRLIFSRSDGDYSVTHLASLIYDSVDGLENSLSSLPGSLSTIITNQGTIIQDLETDGIWLTNLTAAANWDTVTVSQSVADMMIAEINSGRHGLYGYFHNGTNYEFLYRPLISYAAIVNGEIRVAARNSSGNNSTMRLVTPNGRRYVVVPDESPPITFDDSNIVAAIDRIYDWLDNADLATNSTIVQLVTDYSTDVNNAIIHSSKILDLFGYSYTEVDDGFTNSDWADAKEYFAQYKG